MDTAVANTVLSPAQESEASGLTESPLHFLPVTQEAMDGIMPFFEKENGRISLMGVCLCGWTISSMNTAFTATPCS